MEKKPHFTMVEIVFGILISLYIFDPLITAAEALPVLGGWIVGMLVWLLFEAYFHFKGVTRANKQSLGILFKKLGWQIIPYANTVMFIMTAIKTNHPTATPEELAEKAEKLEKFAGKVKGKIGRAKKAGGALGKLAKAA